MELEFNTNTEIGRYLKDLSNLYPSIKQVLEKDPLTYEYGVHACFEWKAKELAKYHEVVLSEDKKSSTVEYMLTEDQILQAFDEHPMGTWNQDGTTEKYKDRRAKRIKEVIKGIREEEEKERNYINNIVRPWNKYDTPKAEQGEYDITSGGIYRTVVTVNEQTLEPQHVRREVCRTPFVICGVSEPLNDDLIYYKVRFGTRTGDVKEFWAAQSDLLSRKELKTLFLNKGMNCPENVLLMETLEYISRSISEYGMRYKKEFSAKRNGWTQGNTSFVLGDRNITSRGIFPILSIGDGKGFPELEKKGTLEGWKAGVSPFLDYDLIRFKFYDIFTAPLNYILGVESHITDHYGNTSCGKTFSYWVALSGVGDPEGLTIGAKSTAKGILVYIRDFSDLPFLIDESSDAGEHLADIIYPLTSNKGRAKSTQDGQRDGGEEYHTSIMFTGERPIRDCLNNSGQMYRVNELDDTLPDLDTKVINNVKRTIRDNHGHLIELYIQEVFKQVEAGTLQQIYEDCFDKLPDKLSNIEGRSKSIFACIMTAGVLLENVFKKIGLPERDPYEIVNKYFHKCILEKPVELEYLRALKVVLDWVHSEYGRFGEVEQLEVPTANDEKQNLDRYVDGTKKIEYVNLRDKNKKYGFVDGNYIDIIGTEFTKKMKDAGFSPSKIKEDWYNRGIADGNDKERLGTYRFSDRSNTKKKIVGVRIFRTIAEDLVGVGEDKDKPPLPPDEKIKLIMETIKFLTAVKESADLNLIRLITEVKELDELLQILTQNGKIFKVSQTAYKWIY